MTTHSHVPYFIILRFYSTISRQIKLNKFINRFVCASCTEQFEFTKHASRRYSHFKWIFNFNHRLWFWLRSLKLICHCGRFHFQNSKSSYEPKEKTKAKQQQQSRTHCQEVRHFENFNVFILNLRIKNITQSMNWNVMRLWIERKYIFSFTICLYF